MNYLNKKQSGNLLFIAWAVAVIALLGSLFFSEIRQYEPCTLCWYQRIFMYPLVLLLGIGYVKRDDNIALYSLFFSGIGGALSLYHYSIQKIPFFADRAIECGRIPCTAQYINWFGFISIPFLALVAFIIIFICSFIIWRRSRG